MVNISLFINEFSKTDLGDLESPLWSTNVENFMRFGNTSIDCGRDPMEQPSFFYLLARMGNRLGGNRRGVPMRMARYEYIIVDHHSLISLSF